MISMFSLKSQYFVLRTWLFCSLGFPHHYRRQNGSSGKRVQPILPGVDGASMPLQIQVRLTCKGTGTATRRATTKRASTQDVFLAYCYFSCWLYATQRKCPKLIHIPGDTQKRSKKT